MMAEHRVFLASLGLFLCAGALIDRAAAWLNAHRVRTGLALAASFMLGLRLAELRDLDAATAEVRRQRELDLVPLRRPMDLRRSHCFGAILLPRAPAISRR